jgi:hypothetical protein
MQINMILFIMLPNLGGNVHHSREREFLINHAPNTPFNLQYSS